MKDKKHQIAILISELTGMQSQLNELTDAYSQCDQEVRMIFAGACNRSLSDMANTFARAITELKKEANK